MTSNAHPFCILPKKLTPPPPGAAPPQMEKFVAKLEHLIDGDLVGAVSVNLGKGSTVSVAWGASVPGTWCMGASKLGLCPLQEEHAPELLYSIPSCHFSATSPYPLLQSKEMSELLSESSLSRHQDHKKGGGSATYKRTAAPAAPTSTTLEAMREVSCGRGCAGRHSVCVCVWGGRISSRGCVRE